MTAELDLTGPTARRATVATAPHGLAHIDVDATRVVITSDGQRVSIKIGELELSCRGPVTGTRAPPKASKAGVRLLKTGAESKLDDIPVSDGPQMGESHWDAIYQQETKIIAVRYRVFRGETDWASVCEPRAVIDAGNRSYLDERPDHG